MNLSDQAKAAAAAGPAVASQTDKGNLEKLLRECRAMIAHALDFGLKVPPKTFTTIERAPKSTEDTELWSLVRAHSRLSEIVKPATPVSIAFLAKEKEKPRTLKWFFPKSVSIARSMAFTGVISLIVFCMVLVLLESSIVSASHTFWYGLLQVVYPLIAASLGASFLALYQANSYIVTRTFDPKYISSYYYRYVLGLMAGMILANLVPGFGSQAAPEGPQISNVAASFSKPVLAMIGGFSASVVYRILFRLVYAVESIVRGDTKDVIDAQLIQERARMNETAMNEKMQSTRELLSIREALNATGDKEDTINRLDTLIESALPPSDS